MNADLLKKELKDKIEFDQSWIARDVHEASLERAARREEKLKMIEEFESLGCTVLLHAHGLLVDDRFVVAIKSNKWRSVDNMKWYWYKNVPDLVNRYFRKVG
jgi:hypothetical protein